MAHGINAVLKRPCKVEGKTGIGSRRIFPPHFKLQVLDSYRNDVDCKGNQRATARKYGIHRRQIQKWLQVENNLRNSVKGKAVMPQVVKDMVTLKSNEYGRQLGDSFPPQIVEARVPQMLSPVSEIVVPLDFTTHSREHASPIAGSPVPNFDPAVPMDLSLKRTTPTGDHILYTPILHRSPTPQLQSPSYLSNPDVWDLSTKTCKRKSEETQLDSTISNPKPIKLFKPYLDDLQDSSSNDDCGKSAEIISNCCGFQYSSDYYNNNNTNNNNNNCYDTYTLHELQPKSSLSQHHYYYQPITPSYHVFPSPECELYYTQYEEPLQPVKQRQSYSLDFKLSAIECYHQDEYCRGSQRAVATKYNVHRRQVQKWLKQEDELRHRNETVKQIHVS